MRVTGCRPIARLRTVRERILRPAVGFSSRSGTCRARRFPGSSAHQALKTSPCIPIWVDGTGWCLRGAERASILSKSLIFRESRKNPPLFRQIPLVLSEAPCLLNLRGRWGAFAPPAPLANHCERPGSPSRFLSQKDQGDGRQSHRRPQTKRPYEIFEDTFAVEVEPQPFDGQYRQSSV